MKMILPIVLGALGTALGVGAAKFGPFGSQEVHGLQDCILPAAPSATPNGVPMEIPPGDREYVKMNNQFIIPVVDSDRIESLVVAALSVEVITGATENVYGLEPKLRDAFLQVFFDHANMGGFDGPFTKTDRMTMLRTSLLDVAKSILGDSVTNILITEMTRQDS